MDLASLVLSLREMSVGGTTPSQALISAQSYHHVPGSAGHRAGEEEGGLIMLSTGAAFVSAPFGAPSASLPCVSPREPCIPRGCPVLAYRSLPYPPRAIGARACDDVQPTCCPATV